MSRQVVRIGDLHQCPEHGDNQVVTGQESMYDPKRVACVGDKCACGGIIIEGAQSLTINGKPVAYTGCKTSCGGIVIGGSEMHLFQ